jgi:lipoate-protein ligase A
VETEWVGTVTAAEYLRGDLVRWTEGRPLARCGVLSDTTVSVGVAVKVPPQLDEQCARRGWPLLRRSSGGTGLLHRPGDLFWSVVLPRSDPRVGRGFVRAYGRYGRPVVDALASAGIESRWAPAFALSERFCLLGSRGEVLVSGDRALGGAAQHLSANVLLHHGLIAAGLDRPAITELFDVPRAVLEERLTSVEELRGERGLESVGRKILATWSEDPGGGA